VPDEEAGSEEGMVWLCENRPDVVDVEFELSEGGGGTTRFGGEEAKLFSIATNEKDICWLKLTSIGRPGHGSVPHADNSAVHLIRALNRLTDWDAALPSRRTPRPTSRSSRRRASSRRRRTARSLARIRATSEFYAMFLNTLNLTMLDAGIKANVIPARSTAVIDCRLLPGQSKDDWIRQVRERIDDDRIVVGWNRPTRASPSRCPGTPSSSASSTTW
jgi:acetylornithine deacetylase/succinyl-diaminopimelate desuccinylase-like protein